MESLLCIMEDFAPFTTVLVVEEASRIFEEYRVKFAFWGIPYWHWHRDKRFFLAREYWWMDYVHILGGEIKLSVEVGDSQLDRPGRTVDFIRVRLEHSPDFHEEWEYYTKADFVAGLRRHLIHCIEYACN